MADTLPIKLPSTTTAPMTSRALLERLRRHYIAPGPMPGGIFVPECGVNGGRQSRADALYVGFTSTSGRILVGHELKISRADWRRELDKVGKADLWADNCHAWYIVAPSTEIVPVEELPDGWGLMVPGRTKTRLTIVVKARVHADRVPSWDVVRSIMARQDTLDAQDRAVFREQAREEERERALRDARATVDREQRQTLTPEQRDRLLLLDQIEAQLGRRLTRWMDAPDSDATTPELVAAALKYAEHVKVAGLDHPSYTAAALERVARQLLDGLKGYRTALAELQAARGDDRG